jgi:hypothetical protein
MITEQNLIDLGFKRIDEPKANFYYYELVIGEICLLSRANDEVKDNHWKIQFYDFYDPEISLLEDLQNLITILQKITK